MNVIGDLAPIVADRTSVAVHITNLRQGQNVVDRLRECGFVDNGYMTPFPGVFVVKFSDGHNGVTVIYMTSDTALSPQVGVGVEGMFGCLAGPVPLGQEDTLSRRRGQYYRLVFEIRDYN